MESGTQPNSDGSARTLPGALDPITLEVVRNVLLSLVNEMTVNLVRTAYSRMVSEIKDVAVGFVDAQGRAVAQATAGLPIFLADLGLPVEDALGIYGLDGFEPGDVVLSNYSGVNGQHLNNVVVFTPVIVEGELLAFPAVRAHWIDVGGKVIGSISHDAREIYEEGIQLRCLKVYRRGEPCDDILRVLRHNARFPDLNLGDLRAQISACRLGERRFLRLLEKFGKETVFACVARIWDEAEIITRQVVEHIPDGTYDAETFMDNDGVNLERPIPLKVRVIVSGSDMTIDLSGLPPQVEGPYNSRGALAAARVAFKYLTSPRLPTHEGCFRNLKVVAPEGTILTANDQAAMAWWNMPIISVVDLIFKALHPAIPQRVTAGHYANISGARFGGINPLTQRPFHVPNPAIGGWGAKHNSDGMSAVVSLGQGDVHNLPVEIEEAQYPVRVHTLQLRQDSGGPGRFRGGLGIMRKTEVLTPCRYYGQLERVQDPPWGLGGGEPPLVSRVTLRQTPDAEERDLPLKVTGHPLQPPNTVTLHTPGGGGYGSPWQRDVGRVRQDVVDGYVSRQHAWLRYGVVFQEGTLEVDEAATAAARREMAAAAADGQPRRAEAAAARAGGGGGSLTG